MRNQHTTIASPNATSNAGPILAELAATAGRHYRKSTASWLDAAAVLLEARKIAQHGDWTKLIRAAGIPARTASRMLDFARTGIEIGHLADLTRSEIAKLITQADQDFPGPPRDWEYAKALIDAVIEIAAERGYDAGDLALFIADFPNRRVPRTQ